MVEVAAAVAVVVEAALAVVLPVAVKEAVVVHEEEVVVPEAKADEAAAQTWALVILPATCPVDIRKAPTR